MDNNGNSSKKRQDKKPQRGETSFSGVEVYDPVTIRLTQRFKMVYRVSSKFLNTESAQRAAQRINKISDGIYEIRLDYRSDRENDNVLYAKNNMAELPSGYGIRSKYSNPLNGLSSIPYGEDPQECYMAVYCRHEVNDLVSQAIINCGGYDISVNEEKML